MQGAFVDIFLRHTLYMRGVAVQRKFSSLVGILELQERFYLGARNLEKVPECELRSDMEIYSVFYESANCGFVLRRASEL